MQNCFYMVTRWVWQSKWKDSETRKHGRKAVKDSEKTAKGCQKGSARRRARQCVARRARCCGYFTGGMTAVRLRVCAAKRSLTRSTEEIASTV